LRTGHFRQAAQQMHRALAFSPGNLVYETALANIALLSGDAQRANRLISSVRQRYATATPELQIEADRIAAFAQEAINKFGEAERMLQSTLRSFPNEDKAHNQLAQLYVTRSVKLRDSGKIADANTMLTNALQVIRRQVTAQPTNAVAHFNLSALEMFANNYEGGAASATRVLELQPNNSGALMNRAMCFLQTKKWDLAKRDYQALLTKHTTTDFRVYYGLGQIAYNEKDWSAAKDYYEQYLRYAPANAAEASEIRQRLQEVKKK
jgi:tetratricopeptide (TPR) repeat protein